MLAILIVLLVLIFVGIAIVYTYKLTIYFLFPWLNRPMPKMIALLPRNTERYLFNLFMLVLNLLVIIYSAHLLGTFFGLVWLVYG